MDVNTRRVLNKALTARMNYCIEQLQHWNGKGLPALQERWRRELEDCKLAQCWLDEQPDEHEKVGA